MTTRFLVIILISMLFVRCNSTDSLIKKDLSSRYTGFEVVEIKPDSANVYDAAMTLMSLKINIAQGNLSMAKAENLLYDKKWTDKRTKSLMDSFTTDLNKRCMVFMNLQFSKPELCYRVKYRIYKDESKIEMEEYYLIHKYGEDKTELLHRPCDWDKYLKEEGCSDLLDQCSKYYMDFLRSQI
jgi:hypothetical protein